MMSVEVGPRLAAAALVVTLLLGGAAALSAAPPAAAADCNYFSEELGDHARVFRNSTSTCAYIGVRHKYDPVWSINNYWTAWYGGSGYSYSTPDQPVLYQVQTKGY